MPGAQATARRARPVAAVASSDTRHSSPRCPDDDALITFCQHPEPEQFVQLSNSEIRFNPQELISFGAMLAAHRDQENLVHAHQVPAKQQPKTPGSRYPKTPMGRFAKNDENAPTAFTGKTILAGTAKNTVNGKLMAKPTGQRQALVTPLGPQSRAPLGNKTTNAKARPNQSGAGKEKAKPIDASQLNPGTQRPKLRQTELAAPKFEVQSDKKESVTEEEPEYGPPAPLPLPYQSDVLPKGGLTFEGLKKEYMLKGYYENFYNPVDAHGVSRLDKAFDDEMKSALDKAVEQHDREFEALDWGVPDAEESKVRLPTNAIPQNPSSRVNSHGNASDRKLQTINSRRAASALAIHSDRAGSAPSSRAASSSKRPLATMSQARTAKPSVIEPLGTTTGEAASRTTIGYSKGRSASSMMRPQHQAPKTLSRPATRQASDDGWDLTITPARTRLNNRGQSPLKNTARPQFTSIFYDEDDAEPVTLSGPAFDCDDDDTFELKLDI